jgi:hypothetical protein
VLLDGKPGAFRGLHARFAARLCGFREVPLRLIEGELVGCHDFEQRAPPRRGSLPAAPARIWNLRWVHAFLAGRAQPCINVANNMLDHLSLTGDEVPSRQRTKHPRARQAPSNLVAADLRVRQPGVNQLTYENTASGPSTNLWTVRAR